MNAAQTIASLCIALLGSSALHATPVIDLAKPVNHSLSPISGVHWSFDTIEGATTPDTAPHAYIGHLDPGSGKPPHLVPGVDLPGTSGYASALRLETAVSENTAAPNPRIYTNLEISNHLHMADTDFTGGAWLKAATLQPGAQLVMIMDRGGYGYLPQDPEAGHWSFYLTKDASGRWKLCFQTSDGLTGQDVAIPVPEIALNHWTHVGFSFRYGGGQESEVTLWVNGQNVGNAVLGVAITAGSADSITRRFSAGDRATGTYMSLFDGAMDDLFVTAGYYHFKPLAENH